MSFRFAALFPLLSAVLLSAQSTADTPFDVEAALSALEKKYSIEIVYETPAFPVQTAYDPIHGKGAGEELIQAYVPILATEFGRYPKDFVKRMGLERIVICKELAFGKQLRAAIPEFGSNTMYFDAQRSMSSVRYATKVIHHEFFHIVDWKDDGKLYSDPKWVKLNEKGFQYGSGGANAQSDDTMNLLTDRYPGFLTKYATTGVEEDKAELFAHLLLEPAVLAERAAKDPILANKLEYLKALLKRFSKKLDARYWAGIEKARKK